MGRKAVKSEAQILQECRIEASRLGAVIFRNNTGKFQDKTGRWVQFGLCVGSSDLIGIYKGLFLALEIKKPGGTIRPEQKQFIELINKNGGIAAIVYDASEIAILLRGIV